MAKAVIRACILNAYSSANIGDGELVDASIEAVLAIADEDCQLLVFATEPDSFRSSTHLIVFLEKPFNRLRFRAATLMEKITLGLTWSLIICLGSLLAVLRPGNKIPEFLFRWCKVGRTLLLISESDVAFAVAGGYLGGYYAPEAILSLWVMWWAQKTGVPVITMPLSISDDKGVFGTALRLLGRNVRWTARDTPTLALLNKAGLAAEVAPDLAFRWTDRQGTLRSAKEGAVVIAPVGAEYLSDALTERLVGEIVTALSNDRSVSRVQLVPMHHSSSGNSDGKDEATARTLQTALTDRGLDTEIVLPTEFGQVVELFRGASLGICWRLHSAIACISAGTPTVVIAYEPKHRGVLEVAGASAPVLNPNCTYIQIREAIAEAVVTQAAQADESHQTIAALALWRSESRSWWSRQRGQA